MQERYIWGGVALAASFLTLYSMVKIWVEAFWKPHPEGRDLAKPVSGLEPAWLAVLLLAALTLAMGLMPEPWVRYTEAAVASLSGASP
jgi:multicomponent Na+:H+ antiporter subunit D